MIGLLYPAPEQGSLNTPEKVAAAAIAAYEARIVKALEGEIVKISNDADIKRSKGVWSEGPGSEINGIYRAIQIVKGVGHE